MAEVLVLDVTVLIPLSVVMVLIRVLHFFVFEHFRFSEQVVVRASNLRASATFSPAKSFQANESTWWTVLKAFEANVAEKLPLEFNVQITESRAASSGTN
ncbi:hypothetical protein Vadar_031341 [Vaccinium darrowii]|uniref:Uncharacterized protein n=1 Tax=Vaccinium darrowii TaxID=229202 RepID=A0ACB7XUU1_9ERIC|nr:hypothetical protein Vadar_031341 [Vaccinium darrowii]